MTWRYRKPFCIIYPPCKNSNSTNLAGNDTDFGSIAVDLSHGDVTESTDGLRQVDGSTVRLGLSE